MTPVIQGVTTWYCPNCGKRDQTNESRPHTRYHVCPRLRYLSAPMVPQGTRAKVTLHEREDYEGSDAGRTRLDPERRRPVMSITTTRDDGQDAVIFAPTADSKGA